MVKLHFTWKKTIPTWGNGAPKPVVAEMSIATAQTVFLTGEQK